MLEMEVSCKSLYDLYGGTCEHRSRGLVHLLREQNLPSHVFNFLSMSTGQVPPIPGLSGMIKRTARCLASPSAWARV